MDKAINSVIQQTYDELEIIVVDDGSDDNTKEVVKSINDNRCVYIKHKVNKGGGAARNTGIKAATGKYIAFLDSDDEWLPKKIELQVKALEDKTDVGVVYCGHYLKYKSLNCMSIHTDNDVDTNMRKKLLSGWLGMSTSHLLIRSECFKEVGCFDPELPSFQEYDLLVRISSQYKFETVKEPLLIKNSGREDQISTDYERKQKGLNMFIDKHGREIEKEFGAAAVDDFSSQRRKKIYLRGSISSAITHDYKTSIHRYCKSVKIHPPYLIYCPLLFLSLIYGGGVYQELNKFRYLLKCM